MHRDSGFLHSLLVLGVSVWFVVVTVVVVWWGAVLTITKHRSDISLWLSFASPRGYLFMFPVAICTLSSKPTQVLACFLIGSFPPIELFELLTDFRH